MQQEQLLISRISWTCFGQSFAHLQEHKAEMFTAYGIVFYCCGRQDTIPYALKISVLCSWKWTKDCPKHVEL